MKIDVKVAEAFRQRIGAYEIDVGILRDMAPAQPAPKSAGFKNLAGGPALKIKGNALGSLSDVAQELDVRHNWLLAPWHNPGNKEVLRVVEEFSKVLTNKNQNFRRLENAAQAVVRNPILRGEYGDNTQETAEAKGFNRLLIRTGRFFGSIKAKARRLSDV